MMRVFTDLAAARATLLARATAGEAALPPRIREANQRIFGRDVTANEAAAVICEAVRTGGDVAVREYTAKIDGVALDALELPAAALREAYDRIPGGVRAALETAAGRIRRFHEREHHDSWWWQDGGDILGQRVLPLARVGIYVPGGTAAYPSSLLMAVIPAKVAGVGEVVMATPPHRDGVNPVVLAAAAIAGVDRVFTVGGAQAVAAMAYGTESVPRVDKILGPGNAFVAAAKRYVFGQVAIDQLAGPTETLVIADDSANPAWVAADMIAQAEHGEDSSAILLTTSAATARAVDAALERQLADLPRAAVVRESMAAHGGAAVVPDIPTAIALANAYAPEHLCLCVREPWQYVGLVRHAGGVFVGEHSPEVLGDYIAGPSHIMPTGGTARFSSAMHVRDFVRTISVIGVTATTAAALAGAASALARAEGLEGHARAARLRSPQMRISDARTRTTTKAALLDEVRRARAEWERLVTVAAPRMDEPGAMGDWTFKDLLSHLTAWQQFEMGALQRAATGNEPEPPPAFAGLNSHRDQDQINRRVYDATHALPLDAVLTEARATWAALEAGLESLPHDALTDPRHFAWMGGEALGTVVFNATAHYHEDHEADVRAWLARYNER